MILCFGQSWWLPGRDAADGGGNLFRGHARGGNVAQLEETLSVVHERSLTGGEGEPHVRRRVIKGNASPGEVQLAELALRTDVITLGGAPIPARGFGGIGRDTTSLPVEVSHRSLPGGAAVFRRLEVPIERLPIVLPNAEAEIVQLTDLEFGIRVSPGGGFPKPVQGLRDVAAAVVEQCTERELRDHVTGSRADTRSRERTLDILVNLRVGRSGVRHAEKGGAQSGQRAHGPDYSGVVRRVNRCDRE